MQFLCPLVPKTLKTVFSEFLFGDQHETDSGEKKATSLLVVFFG